MGFGRRGGFWAGVVAVLSGIVVIVLAMLFSALFLGLFVADRRGRHRCAAGCWGAASLRRPR